MPGDKKEFIKDTSVELPAVGSYINRQLARVAGILMSLSAAVNMAPLDLRMLYQSMGENMSSTADDAGLAREDLQYWHDNIDICDGESWSRKADNIHICGDAAKVGYGAYTPNAAMVHFMVIHPNGTYTLLVALSCPLACSSVNLKWCLP